MTLQVRGLSVRYGPVTAVRGISLHVEPGELVGVVGSNGAGKTSTLMAIMGALPRGSVTGTVEFDGGSLTRMRASAVARRGLGLVPEGRRIFTRLSVRENLQIAMVARGHDVDRGGEIERILGAFPGLRPLIGAPAGRLSGGEQQQLAIARCLLGSPRLLLLDEPSLGLAPLVASEIFALIRQLSDEGRGVLVVDQNARVVARLADRLYVMRTGHIVDELTGQARSDQPRLFLGYFGVPQGAGDGPP